jgi:hypothetical protein
MESVYRGDTRRPELLFAQGGFKAWEPLTIEEARDLILLYTGLKSLSNCCFADKVKKGLISLETTSETAKRTPLDLSQLIIRSKQRGPSISTEPTEGCGGYSSGYIYKIDCSGMDPVDWEMAVPGLEVSSKSTWWPTLCLDSSTTLSSTSSIAIKSKSQKGGVEEVTFFNSIAPERTILQKKPATEATKTKLAIGDSLIKVILETKQDTVPKPAARWAAVIETTTATASKEGSQAVPGKLGSKVVAPRPVTPPAVTGPKPVVPSTGLSIKERIKQGGFDKGN